jgi:hypothetical protein
MMVELWMRNRVKGDEEENDMEDMSGYKKSEVYDLPDWVQKTLYRCDYPPAWEPYLPYQGWLTDSHMKFP